MEITSWLVSAFSDPSQRVNNKNRTNEPTMKSFVYYMSARMSV